MTTAVADLYYSNWTSTPKLLAVGVHAATLTAWGSNRIGTRGNHRRPICDGTRRHLTPSDNTTALWLGFTRVFLHIGMHHLIQKTPLPCWALHKGPREQTAWCMFFSLKQQATNLNQDFHLPHSYIFLKRTQHFWDQTTTVVFKITI